MNKRPPSLIKVTPSHKIIIMETKIKQVNVSILKPNAGCVLTQSAEVDLQNRVFSEEIWLAATDSTENWKDISIEEAEQLKQQQQELIANEQTPEENIPTVQ